MNELIKEMITAWRDKDSVRLQAMKLRYTGLFKLLAGELLISVMYDSESFPSVALDYINTIREEAS